MIKKIIYPEIYQGQRKKDKYFEGWYFKLVDPKEQYALALIPGVSINKKDSHAFIQVFLIDRSGLKPAFNVHYIRYPIDRFAYAKNLFDIRIADNHFTKEKIDILIKKPGLRLEGTVHLNNMISIRKSVLAPNIMGFFGYFGFMECYHGVISLNHELSGTVCYNKTLIDFERGKGYLEKDWGKSFPRAYVWIQTNHFQTQDISLMFSYADIPFLGMYFKGLISVLYVKGKEYRFSTYNFAKVVLEVISNDAVKYVIKKGRYRLNIHATKDHTVDLPAPKDGVMDHTIKEGLSGKVEVVLTKGKKIIYHGVGTSAGIEIMKKS